MMMYDVLIAQGGQVSRPSVVVVVVGVVVVVVVLVLTGVLAVRASRVPARARTCCKVLYVLNQGQHHVAQSNRAAYSSYGVQLSAGISRWLLLRLLAGTPPSPGSTAPPCHLQSRSGSARPRTTARLHTLAFP